MHRGRPLNSVVRHQGSAKFTAGEVEHEVHAAQPTAGPVEPWESRARDAISPMSAMECRRIACLIPIAVLLAGWPGIASACPDTTRPSSPQFAFGPEQNPESLILDVASSAKSSLRLSAFALSSPAVVKALIGAANRGVDVRVVVDRKHNVVDDPKRIGREALDALVAGGVVVRANGAHRLHHDKFMVVDECHVQTGSWNYAESAKRNSENVVVLWNSPAAAKAYLAHWQSRFNEAVPYP